jgi:hypothetical protein
MVDLGMEVELVPLQSVNQCVLFINQLVQSLNFLGQHDNFVLKVFYFHLYVLVIIKSLLQVHDLSFVGLDLVVAIP